MIIPSHPALGNSGDTPPTKCESKSVFGYNCRLLACTYCNGRVSEHWKATVQHRLTEHNKVYNRPMVWMFWCDAIAWGTVSHNLQVKHSSYFRLETTPGRLLVVSSEQPTSAAITGLSEVTTEDAANRLCAAIASGPVREKQLTSSRGWKLDVKKLQATAQEKRPS